MHTLTRMFMLVAMLLVPAPLLLAQSVAEPLNHLAGHWEGSVQLPEMELKIEVDLVKNGKGELAGTLSNPTQGLKGFPLSSVTVEGRSVRLVIKAGQEVSTFVGTLSPDAKSISGDASQGGHSVPFSLTRTGEARMAPSPKSPAIGKELEGTWNGTLDAGEQKMRLIKRDLISREHKKLELGEVERGQAHLPNLRDFIVERLQTGWWVLEYRKCRRRSFQSLRK